MERATATDLIAFLAVARERNFTRAAAQLGKFEPVEQVLFQNQEKWEQTGDVDGTVAGVLSAAEMTKVRALVKGGTLEPLIDKDVQLGQMYRVSQTPTTVFHSRLTPALVNSKAKCFERPLKTVRAR